MTSKLVRLRKLASTQWMGNGCGTETAHWEAISRVTGEPLGTLFGGTQGRSFWLFKQPEAAQPLYKARTRGKLIEQIEEYAADLLRWPDTHEVQNCRSCWQAFCSGCSEVTCEKCLSAACYHCNNCPECENDKWASGQEKGIFYADPEFLNCKYHGTFCEATPCCDSAYAMVAP